MIRPIDALFCSSSYWSVTTRKANTGQNCALRKAIQVFGYLILPHTLTKTDYLPTLLLLGSRNSKAKVFPNPGTLILTPSGGAVEPLVRLYTSLERKISINSNRNRILSDRVFLPIFILCANLSGSLLSRSSQHGPYGPTVLPLSDKQGNKVLVWV